SIAASNATFASSTINFSGLEALQIDGTDGDDTVTIAEPLPFSPLFAGGLGNDRLNVNAGTYNFIADAAATTANLSVVTNNAAIVNFNASQHLASLKLNGTGQANLAPGGSRFLRTGALALAPDALLNIADNALILQSAGDSRAAVLS